MNINSLIESLDIEKNQHILKLSSKKIIEMNLDILKELHLGREITLDYLKKLKNYRYIDEINELKYGAYIRWIPIIDPNNLPLHYAGIICDIKTKPDGTFIVCKNFMHRHYTFKMDECLIFQKLTNQELVIMNALDYLDKNEDLDDDPDSELEMDD
jgi:hypothetical protein